MEKAIVEFCMLNIGNGSRKAKELLERDPNIEIKTFGCLHKCSTCFRGCYAFVNDEIVTGDTPEQLVENIYLSLTGIVL
ncbi:DUF1450 domain-containing protein [Bacillus benzoevorans]|uniref:Uncharacterized protein YuzB (UPF0349 family) n=1 Tax=Bacillus benzoevorans TaxID=1456 RepID=A0A7X0HP25_9BACI|nr:DUF1450 domain-containing protein [Bacillus benzoevorans]MBB6444337.1 uncharacterized protein YuzB (UPF0349 family) [Bacillus benzoevorans]